MLEPDADEAEIIAENDEEKILRYKPKVISKWQCEYFNSPRQMARLAQHQMIIVCVLLFMYVMSLSISTISVYAGMVLLAIIGISFWMRYSNMAFFGKAVPTIPILSDIYFLDSSDEDDEEKNKEDYQEKVAKEADIEYVKPVEDIRNGYPSPATILTRWMNHEAQWTIEDLIESSGGLLDNFKVSLMMKNDENAWQDREILDVISRISNSNPREWKNAYAQWSNDE